MLIFGIVLVIAAAWAIFHFVFFSAAISSESKNPGIRFIGGLGIAALISLLPALIGGWIGFGGKDGAGPPGFWTGFFLTEIVSTIGIAAVISWLGND